MNKPETLYKRGLFISYIEWRFSLALKFSSGFRSFRLYFQKKFYLEMMIIASPAMYNISIRCNSRFVPGGAWSNSFHI